MSTLPSKPCAVCGRIFTWRRKWARDWDHVKYCSAACRQAGLTPLDEALEADIVTLLQARRRGGSICPSEVARRVATHGDWRSLMEPTRRAARRLVAKGEVEITQRGQVVDPSTARGPIRIRFPS